MIDWINQYFADRKKNCQWWRNSTECSRHWTSHTTKM